MTYILAGLAVVAVLAIGFLLPATSAKHSKRIKSIGDGGGGN